MVQKGHHLSFACTHCDAPVGFSVLDLETPDAPITCEGCEQIYSFDDETLKRQLRKFEALCRQIVDSEEILSDVSVGIDVDGRQVQVPYKLLLTRFNSVLEMTVGDQPITIEFRLEALQDHPAATAAK